MAEIDTCPFCQVGVPRGSQCNCSGAKSARQNNGRPDNLPPVSVSPDEESAEDFGREER